MKSESMFQEKKLDSGDQEVSVRLFITIIILLKFGAETL